MKTSQFEYRKMPKKILQIMGDSEYGGATYLILLWCQYLLSRGCQVTVLTTNKFTVNKMNAIPGIRIINTILIPRKIKLFQDFKAFFQLFLHLRQQKYDVVHTYTATPSFLGRIVARFVGVPVIIHHQAGWVVTEYSTWMERIFFLPLEYLATMASTASICVSEAVTHQASQYKLAPLHKLVTIYNGINPLPIMDAVHKNLGANVRQELGITNECLLIGSSGRLAAQKDHYTLLRSISIFKTLFPEKPIMLVLAGDGPERAKLEEYAHSLDLSDEMRFLGFYENIPAFLAAVDIFVSCSLREGLSISLLEAMAATRPIIATSIPPNAELIQNEQSGLLVEPKSAEQIAMAIIRFIREPELARRCSVSAREIVIKQYSLDRMFQETWDLYLSLLAKTNGRD